MLFNYYRVNDVEVNHGTSTLPSPGPIMTMIIRSEVNPGFSFSSNKVSELRLLKGYSLKYDNESFSTTTKCYGRSGRKMP